MWHFQTLAAQGGVSYTSADTFRHVQAEGHGDYIGTLYKSIQIDSTPAVADVLMSINNPDWSGFSR